MTPLSGLTGHLSQHEGPWELGQQAAVLHPSSGRSPAACTAVHTVLVLTGSCQPTVSRDVLAVCRCLFCRSRLFALLLAELFLIILFGLLCSIINS